MFAVQIRPEILSRLRQEYTPGTEVELVSMTDPYRDMQPGLRGVVDLVDDAGGIHINWSNGSGLAVLPGIDDLRVVSTGRMLSDLLKEMRK